MNTNNHQVRPLKKEEELDIKKVLDKFMVKWKFYLYSFLVIIALVAIFILYSTPMFTVHSQVLIQDNSDKGPTTNSTSFGSTNMLADFSGLFTLQSNVNNEMSIISTKDLLEKTINSLHLDVTYYTRGVMRDLESYNTCPYRVEFTPISDSILLTEFDLNFPDSGKSSRFTVTSSDISFKTTAKFGDTIKTSVGKFVVERTGIPFNDNSYNFTVNAVDAVVLLIQDELTISIPNTLTTVIEIDYNTNIQRKGEAMVGQLISEYLQRNLAEKNEISDSTISFINSRINLVSADLGTIETNIEHFKQKNNLADIPAQAQILVQNSSAYYQKLNEAEVQINVVTTMLDYLTDEKNDNRPVPALLTTDPTFLQLMEQYNLLVTQRERLSLTVKDNNPIASNIDTQLKNLRADLIKSLRSQQKDLEISRDKLIQQSNQVAGDIQNVPVQEREFVDLNREKEMKQTLYLYLLQKKEETAITRASNIPNASVIQPPKSDFLPYFPSKVLIGAATLLLALVVPTGFIIMKQLLSNKIVSREDITDVTTLPIIAEVGHYDGEGILDLKESGRTSVAEQFRVFRTNVDFLAAKKTCPVIMITSTISGEGKSFISSGLASVYAYGGKKVLLMEMDLRKPKLSALFGVPNDTGFTSYIIGNRPVEEFIRALPGHPNIYLLSSGLVPPNPAELLLNEKVADLFAELRTQFDVILIDSAPIGAVTDAQVLSKYTDINLYVIRQGFTYKNSIEFINELVESGRIDKLYLVVNDLKKPSSYRYGYGHGIAYGYGYPESKKKRSFLKN